MSPKVIGRLAELSLDELRAIREEHEEYCRVRGYVPPRWSDNTLREGTQ